MDTVLRYESSVGQEVHDAGIAFPFHFKRSL